MNSSMNLNARVQPVPRGAYMIDDHYYIWCASVVEGHDGRFHMLYSRWPRELGHYAWVTDSEVAYASSDHPLGPYTFQSVALPRRGGEYWDGQCTHNPTITRIHDRYYLYYMGTTGTKKGTAPPSSADPNWWEFRNNQRIGVAVADHPSGPWTRFDRPAIDVSPEPAAFDSVMTSNPAATAMQDGRVLLVYKGVTTGPTYRGGIVRYGAAIADRPEGPFVKQSGRVFESEQATGHSMIAEDPFIWRDGDHYYAIARDVVGLFTGEAGGIALFESIDGLNWRDSLHPKVLGASFQRVDGTSSKQTIERPQLLLRQGKPSVLFGGVDINHPWQRSHSYNVFIPLNLNE